MEKTPNALDAIENNHLNSFYYPERALQWETDESGRVVVLVPKFRNRLAVRFLLPRMSRPWFRVHLDEFGSFVWRLCDGKHTVADIAAELSAHFGKKLESATERTARFIQTLNKEKFIHLHDQNLNAVHSE